MGRRGRLNNTTAAASCLELSSLHGAGPGSVASGGPGSACSYPPDRDRDGDDDDAVLDDFERRVDSLFEKRGATRERALEALAVMMRVDVRDADCQQHSETITSRCLQALRRGSAMESSLASQLLGLHVLTLGQPDESLFEALRPELERTAGGANGGGGAVAAAAVDALVLSAFVLCEDELAGTRPVMERLRAMWKKGDPKARAAAVRGWSFLLTSLDGQLSEAEAAACLAGLAAALQPEQRDHELRTAAGEALGVLRACCSARVLQALEEGEEEEEEDGGGEEEEEEEDGEGEGAHRQHLDAPAGVEEAGGHHGAANGKAGRGGGRKQQQHQHVEDVLGRMQELASNKGEKLRRSRRERAAQRSTFRGLLASLAGDDSPCCRVKLQHGDVLELEGVAAVHRLAFLRRFLAGGFQAHLQHNALLHDVFGFRPRAERPDRLTALEKRLTRGSQSAGAKARSANRTWSRDAKASRMMMEAY
ncbi:hypothetical protein HYH02_009090 [Chlamydomonas schloesseri]|uniref:Interferon-related developmental regulator N-terminal domain-containing protein n=1 Tax=Chlamydomonas schloesseri TaxID=2026947 RepID=A0A835WB73_9CHLO|nr:hypothetical protein HYH02_009090 [Chlamydomonas schloesseri]|eukprot:KAG2444151.1 hypothetical protein HYH02_009090 [Chlamydomonas schloesseri]